MATRIKCVIDPDGTGDYTSLAAAEADNFGTRDIDLIANDEHVEALMGRGYAEAKEEA